MYRRSAQTLARLRANLEGHTNEVSSVCAQFTMTGSVATVIAQQVAMSSEPQFGLPDCQHAFRCCTHSIHSSTTSSPPTSDNVVDTAKSSSPIVGSGPPLSDGILTVFRIEFNT